MPNDDYDALFDIVGRKYDVNPALIKTVFHLESSGNPDIRDSPQGAQGGMQIMPGTARMLNVNPRNFAEAVDGAGKYLAEGIAATGTAEGALAYYHGGPDRRIWGAKTQAYVAKGQGLFPTMAIKRSTPPPRDEADGESIFARLLKGGSTPADGQASNDGEEIFRKLVAGNTPPPVPAVATRNSVPTPDAPGDTAAMPSGPLTVPQFPADAPPWNVRLRNALAPIPDGAEVLPLAGDATKGTLRLAMPNSLLALGRGVLDLAEGPATGTVSPEGTMALTMGVGGPGMSSVARGTGRSIADAAMPRNRLAPAATEPAALPMPAMSPLGEAIPDFLPPGVRAPEPPPARPAAPPEFLPPSTPVAPVEPSPRRSAGAAAATDQEANMSRKEMVAQRATAERDRLMEPQPAGPDTNAYIPGVQTTEAQYMQRANLARDEKRLEMEMPEPFKEVRRQNNEARVQFYSELEGTPVLRRRLEEARDAQAQADLRAAWSGKQAANIQPVQETAAAILESPDGRRPAVRAAVDQVTKELVSADGKPITDPEMLYGVRKHIDDLLEAKDGSGTKVNDRVRAQLLELKGALDGVIEQAAPGFGQYLKNFAEASKPIDEMALLQEYAPKIRDSQGRITYSGVQRMLRDVVTAREGKATHPAQGISDETMNKLWALRDDLRRVASAEELAKARGSDTTQNTLDMIKSVGARGAGEALGLAVSGVPGASLVMSGINNVLRKGKLERDVARHLNPNVNRLAPPP